MLSLHVVKITFIETGFIVSCFTEQNWESNNLTISLPIAMRI